MQDFGFEPYKVYNKNAVSEGFDSKLRRALSVISASLEIEHTTQFAWYDCSRMGVECGSKSTRNGKRFTKVKN